MPSQRGQETGEMCPKCQKPLVQNFSKKTGTASSSAARGSRTGCKYIKPARARSAARGAGADRASVPDVRQADAADERMGKGGAGQFLGCSGLPRVQDDDELRRRGQAGPGAQADGAHLREVRQADGAARGPARAVPGLHRLSEVQATPRTWTPTASRSSSRKSRQARSARSAVARWPCVKRGPRGPFLGCSGLSQAAVSTKPVPAELRKEQLKTLMPTAPPKKAAPGGRR